ncbi:hypothetical protein C8N43_2594 [Litoreibacter ponti]|uniref:Alpha/beta hydrolase n=1 Tax=Litoreibacter ponti TaxID=1510457 RepID=A0A2T6BPB5_9RHOB|nr:hypothetical protein [Litoreibacter ponti]PTX57919.1 hypothetical protein C8N43_2594 [Litoreibacter ponti]
MTNKTPRLEFTLLHDVDPLRIEATPGTSGRLVVSFTSVGRERETRPPKEFVSMTSRKGLNHVICVTDMSRSWMNANGMAAKIVSVISDYVLEHQITQIIAIGSSMGAFNALVMGRKMPFTSIIAFAPQYSVHPEVVPDEKRWWWFRRQITQWPHKALDKLPSNCSIYMFHGDTPDEQMHWRLMPEAENVKHFIFAGGDHNFVRNLKASDTLRKMVFAGLNDRVGRMKQLVRRAGGMKRSEYEGFSSAEAYFREHPKLKRPANLT